jgi:predicted nuclease of predicted toxin-antitoxin system
MKLLFDHNLSPQLVNRFADLYPDSQHVFLLGMDQDDDRQIWEYAAQPDFTIVTSFRCCRKRYSTVLRGSTMLN